MDLAGDRLEGVGACTLDQSPQQELGVRADQPISMPIGTVFLTSASLTFAASTAAKNRCPCR
jgi:hypothetical protein